MDYRVQGTSLAAPISAIMWGEDIFDSVFKSLWITCRNRDESVFDIHDSFMHET